MKITKYIFVLSALFCLNLYAGSDRLVKEMQYMPSYKEALKKAKELNKPIQMVVGQEGCPYCMRFEVKTLVKKKVNTLVQKDFVALSVLRYKDEFPKEFEPMGVPTVLFIDPKSQKAFYKSFGYKTQSEYKQEMEEALKIFNTLK